MAAIDEGFEANLRRQHELGLYQQLATLAIDAYEADLVRMLRCVAEGHQSDVEEAWSVFLFDFWRGLPRFAWRSSLKTWMHRLARNALLRIRTSGWSKRRSGAEVDGALDEAGAELRQTFISRLDETSRAPLQRTEAQELVVELMKEFDDDQQWLVVYRIQLEWPWTDIATVMAEPGEDVGKVSARLRKRFERVQRRLSERADELGVVYDKRL